MVDRVGRVEGKHCFVTGAAQGIGRAIAELLHSEGGRVYGADAQFKDVLPSGITPVTLDVTDDAAVKRVAAQFTEVSVLANCVGIVATGTIMDCSMEEFDRSLNVNVRSMVLTTKAFLPQMLQRKSGSIINIASVVSSVMAAPQRFAYGTSKAAVIGLTMAVARDFITQGIRCNSISPGTVDSPSLHERFAATGDAAAARTTFVARQPMGRLGTAAEVAATALLLASDESAFISGSNIIIDGGMSL